MSEGKPELVASENDDYHAEHVGRTSDGRQFFLTPFVPAIDKRKGNEFVALYLFDGEGKLIEAKIDEPGPRENMDEHRRAELIEERLTALGEVSRKRIEVAPFEVERFGTTFGLVARPPEDVNESWWVEAQPGNYMAFTEPFDSGEYDT
jgi:hypothetical protein